jgi:uncharacterized metal-binding protein
MLCILFEFIISMLRSRISLLLRLLEIYIFCDRITGILKSSASTLKNARTQSKTVVTNKLAWIKAYLKNDICSAGQDILCFLTL